MYAKRLFCLVFSILTPIFTASSYTICHLQQQDCKALQQCYQAVAASSPNIALKPDEITDEYITQLVTACCSGLALVAKIDNKIIGYMLKQRYSFVSSRHVLHGGSIGVHPDFRGQGIGTKLISTFLHEVATSHTDILRVEIYAAESNPAYRLYQRLGFETEGILKNGKLHDDGHLESYYCMVWFNPNFTA